MTAIEYFCFSQVDEIQKFFKTNNNKGIIRAVLADHLLSVVTGPLWTDTEGLNYSHLFSDQ